MNNNHKFRYAIYAAVSTDPQAREDKGSLDDQVQTARSAGLQQGGIETAGPFVLDGYSRTGYVNLSDALSDIPPLAEAVEAAIQNQYDVLIMDNIERMGDLAPMLSTLFKKHRKQIHSARQSGRVHDPDSYDPSADESADIMINVEGIIQKYRINKLRRGWAVGMPRRVRDGLTPLKVPFGYRWVNKKEPPQLDPQQAALIVQMKDLLLKGRTLTAIARHADESGIRPPHKGDRWDPGTVRYMLMNPYYAGIVGINRRKYIPDPRRKSKTRSIAQPRSKWVLGEGKHECLWDDQTHLLLVHELERRRETHKQNAARFPLSGLLTCSECRRKLHRRTHGHGARRWKVFSCEAGPACTILPYEEVIDLVGKELELQLEAYPRAESKSPDVYITHNEMDLEDLAKRRKRIQEGYENGLYTQLEAAQKLGELEKQMSAIEHKMDETQRRAEIRAEFVGQIQEHLPHMADWIRSDDPALVNRLLNALCEDIIIHPDRTVEVKMRG